MTTAAKRKKLVVCDNLLNYYHLPSILKKNNTVLFLHGWRSNSQLWFKVIDQLIKKNYELYFLDLPGFGQSGKVIKSLNLDDYADIVLGFLKKIGLTKITVIGHSFGGAVGIKLALKQPPIISKLVLVDSSGIRTQTAKKKIGKFIAKIVKPIFTVPTLKPLREKIYRLIGAEDYVATPELVETYINVIKENLTHKLKNIKSPTLLIWGENDKETPIKDALLMTNEIKGSQLVIMKNAGHFSFLDQPKTFQDEIIKFLTAK